MEKAFIYQDHVRPEWIDYNGHMQDAFYGLVFSYAVDHVQDTVGFDQAYRDATGCTIYVTEDHRKFLREVHEGAALRVETYVVDVSDRGFHLHQTMWHAGRAVCVSEAIELHVAQQPKAHVTPMPKAQHAVLRTRCLTPQERATLKSISQELRLPSGA